MLRIHFTAQDLVRIRVVVLGPLAETQMSLRTLQDPAATAEFAGWREAVGRRAPTAVLSLGRFLSPVTSGILDLFTLVGPAPDVDGALDRLLGAPGLGAELAVRHPQDHLRPAWISPAADAVSRRRIADVLRAGHRVAVEPFWQGIRNVLEGERQRCARLLVDGGVEALLSTLHPTIRWHDGTLELTAYRPYFTSELALSGRGLVLAPSFFCRPGPQLFGPYAAPGDSPVLVYPVGRDVRVAATIWAPDDQGSERAVSALLGRARASVLRVVGSGALTTTDIARRAELSPASASEHATVLREAGLITSQRDRNRMLHAITPLGAAILNGVPRPG